VTFEKYDRSTASGTSMPHDWSTWICYSLVYPHLVLSANAQRCVTDLSRYVIGKCSLNYMLQGNSSPLILGLSIDPLS